jgi:hypothetical protein
LVEEDKVKPLSLPITIKSGETVTVFVRVGVAMEPSSYQLIKTKFGDKTQYEVREIEHYLRKQQTDIYGKISLNRLHLVLGFIQY